jgi:DsbC/DsbD-like thiol-disulfide interchange protein
MSKNTMSATYLVMAILWIGQSAIAGAANPSSQARLIAEVESIQPGTPFTVGVMFSLPAGWHTYWINPGDSGMAPQIEWRLTDGLAAGPVQWPTPQRFGESPVIGFGYAQQVVCLAVIQPAASLPTGQVVKLAVKADWLICDGVCLPQTANLQLSLPTSAQAPTPSAAWQPVFTQARKSLAVVDPAWTFQADADGKSVTLRATPPAGTPYSVIAHGYFFPTQREVVSYGSETWIRSTHGYALAMRRFAADRPLPDRLQGILILPAHAGQGGQGIAVDAALLSRKTHGGP